MLKLIGVVLIIIASSGIGYYIPRIEKNRYEFLKDLKNAFIIFNNEINYSINTLPYIFFNISNKTNNQELDRFFKFLYIKLENKRMSSVKELWECAVDRMLRKCRLEATEIKYIKDFGICLGYLDKNMQLMNINVLIKNLEESIDKYKEKYERFNKLYCKLGILLGIAIVIVMM